MNVIELCRKVVNERQFVFFTMKKRPDGIYEYTVLDDEATESLCCFSEQQEIEHRDVEQEGILLDMQNANLFCQCYEGLCEANKEKSLKIPIMTSLEHFWKFV